MKTIFDNFLNLRALNVESVVVLSLGGIYTLLIITSLLSILFKRTHNGLFKLGWGLAVLLMPFVGMALYALACLWMADRSLLNQLGILTSKKSNARTSKLENVKLKQPSLFGQ